MAQLVTIIETYWSVCWKWVFPYPCRKHRTVQKWEYIWLRLKETGYGVFSRMDGCEQGGFRHKWTAFSFNIWGSTTYFNITKYYSTKRPDNGNCENTEPPIIIV